MPDDTGKDEVERIKKELENLRQSQKGSNFIAFISLVIPWGALVAIAYFLNQSIASLAGKATAANIKIGLSTDIAAHADKWIAYALSSGGLAYGLAERKFRRAKVAYLTDRNAKLEKIIDPNRDSSNLLPTGETRMEDRP